MPRWDRWCCSAPAAVDIELMKDVALAGAPLDADEARQLIRRTKAGVKLRGYRGKPRAA